MYHRAPGLPRKMVAHLQRDAGLPEGVVQRTLSGNGSIALSAATSDSQICFSRTEAFLGMGAVAIVGLALVGTLVTVLKR